MNTESRLAGIFLQIVKRFGSEFSEVLGVFFPGGVPREVRSNVCLVREIELTMRVAFEQIGHALHVPGIQAALDRRRVERAQICDELLARSHVSHPRMMMGSPVPAANHAWSTG